MKCSVSDCGSEATRKRTCLCEKHYLRLRRYGDVNFTMKAANGSRKEATCSVPNCDRPVQGRNLCNMHLQREHRTGCVGEATARHEPKGIGTISYGYKVHTVNGKKLKEHRLKAAQAMGKILPAKAVVHHLNGNRADNRACNLVVCPDESYHRLLHKRQKQFGYIGPEIPQSNAE